MQIFGLGFVLEDSHIQPRRVQGALRITHGMFHNSRVPGLTVQLNPKP